ncbi:MAG: aspartate kinase [Thermodesulfobacteriota bacterium]|nr:MAG: aspartate kinase [Candidatus Dadabacteria bacterium]|tara:strand:+ start:23267 stop:24490 length:1224 start_codon:yes stop_codon:yes gene_type:complete
MDLIVQKYGGTSVGTTEKIKHIAKNISKKSKLGKSIVIVVSAMAGETDRLDKIARKISGIPNEKEYDQVISAGEKISAGLLSIALIEKNVKAISLDPSKFNLLTDDLHSKAKILSVGTKKIKELLRKGYVVVIPGFQGINSKGDVTTLGRGGSDLTAVALASALNASHCELLKDDVDGIYTTDPKLYKAAKKINYISYPEMLEMSSLGSKVLQAKAVEYANNLKVKLYVKSTTKTLNKGTWVMEEKKIPIKEKKIITGITHDLKQSKITVSGIEDVPGVASKIFKPIGAAGIVVDMIVQNISTNNKTDLTFTVPKDDLNKTVKILKTKSAKINYKEIIENKDIALISIVGAGMKTHTGVATRMFDALSKSKINITMISTSEIKISCVIDQRKCKKAIESLHKEFKLG